MSGILGIWNLDGRPVEQSLLAQLNAQISHRGPDGEGFWRDGPAGLAHQMLRITPESLGEVQPLKAPSGAVIVFDGRLDNRAELLGLVEGVGPHSPDCALVLAAYDRYGDSTPERLNGDFAFVIWDPSRQQLLLARDAIGTRPLYYWRTGQTFLFASEIKPILAHPEVRTRPNEETLADWILRFPGEDNRGTTFFEGIYSVPPSHQVVISQTGLSARRYWDFDKTRSIRFATYPEYVEAFRHYFDQAVRRRLRSAGSVTIAVSGGVDSSSLFCWAETLRRASPNSVPELRAVSLIFPAGTKANEEVYLDEIERMYGVAIHRIPATLAGPLAGAEEEILRLESPLLELQGATLRAFGHAVKESDARLVLLGTFADEFLSDPAYLVDYLAPGQWRKFWHYARLHPLGFRKHFPRQAASFHLPRPLTRMIKRLRPPWVSPPWDRGLFADSFRCRILEKEKAWKAFSGPFGSAHTASLYRRARSRYCVLLRECSNRFFSHQGLEWAYPFLDRDLLGFLMAIPGEVVTTMELKKKLLRSAMRDVLPPAIADRRGKASLDHLFSPIVAQQLDLLLQRIQPHGSNNIRCIDHARAEKYLARDRDAMIGRWDIVRHWGDLVGMEVWLDVFWRKNE